MRRVTLYDSMSREVRVFEPLHPPRVGLFVCGLTPYDEAHIGHARTFVFFDVVARALTRWGYRVFHVQNVTNLDDKVVVRAAELDVDPLALSERNFLEWARASTRLGIRSVNYYPFATDYTPEIVAQIQQLIDRGFAYASEGSVYYSVARFPRYGALSGQRVEELRPGARVEVDPAKRSPEDFVIWKAATPGEPTWESPWGPGRPGWHIEDTAITVRLFGPRYDLHGGGLDLIFPHHEAEVALAEAATGESPLVNYWVHGGMLNMNGEKMAKSVGNVYSLASALDEFGPMTLRFFYLNAQYRSPLEFVRGKSLEEAREAYATLSRPAHRLREVLDRADRERPGDELPDDLADEAEALVDRLDEVLAHDFNTREALALLFGWGRRLAEPGRRWDSFSGSALVELDAPYRWAEEVLGLFVRPATPRAPGRDRGVEAAVGARARARARGDYAEADRIRDDLASAGIELEDDASGTRWSSVDRP